MLNRIDSRVSFKYFFAIGVIAAGTIFCEIALTRLFSVVQYYHGAFLAISLALFGFAASGVYVFLRSEALGIDELDGTLARHGLLFAGVDPKERERLEAENLQLEIELGLRR